MKRKKIVSMLLASAMAATLLAGCGAGGKSSSKGDSDGEIKEFTAFFAVPGSEINDDNEVQQIIAEKTGAKVKETWLTGQTDVEAIGTMIAGGEYPDFIEGGNGQMQLYDAYATRMKEMLSQQNEKEFHKGRMQILSELTKLRQLCCDPALVYENYEGGSAKLDLCIELIQSAVESGHKILLFSQFTSMIEILTARLQEESISCFVLQGSTKKEQRAQMVEQFNRDDTSVFCISLKAGGTGLNLTGADIVIHYDPWWNVAVENQATDRAHRIGQKNVVTVYKLIAKGTIEEKIIKLQQMKKELAEEILSGDEIKTASFQREELLELLEERF